MALDITKVEPTAEASSTAIKSNDESHQSHPQDLGCLNIFIFSFLFILFGIGSSINTAEYELNRFTLNCSLEDATLSWLGWFIVTLDYIPWIFLELTTFYVERFKRGKGKSKWIYIMWHYWVGFFLVNFVTFALITEQPLMPPLRTDKIPYDSRNSVIRCRPPLPSLGSIDYAFYKETWLFRLFFSRVSRRIVSITYTTTFLSAYVSFRSRRRIPTLILTVVIALAYSASCAALLTLRGAIPVLGMSVGFVLGCLFASVGFLALYLFLQHLHRVSEMEKKSAESNNLGRSVLPAPSSSNLDQLNSV